MFDSFVPDNKYSPDGYIDYNYFTSKVKMYEFIIEAFEHYYDRVSKKDFYSIEVLNEFINKQKEVE